MQEIIIDEEFKILLPTLDEQTYRLLEENILEHGCRDPLVLWNGILIDGYNRYNICTEHNIPFNTVDKEFNSREEALIWIISNQVSRRNLTPIQLSYFRGLHYEADKKVHDANNRYERQSRLAQNEPIYFGATASRLAEQYRVSRETIKRDSKLAEALNSIGEASPEAKRKILSEEVAIDKNKLESLSSATTEEIEAVAAEIEEGTYKRRSPRTPTQTEAIRTADSILPGIRQLNVVIKDFANNFNSMLQQLNNGGDVEFKTVLRSYIDQLEDLYKNIR